MALAMPLDSTNTARRDALPPATLAGIARSIADLRATGAVDQAVGVGGFIALPILSTIDDRPVDLIEFAADRPVVLVFCGGGRHLNGATTLRAYAEVLPRIEAAGGALIAVTSERPGRPFETACGKDFAVVVDKGDRFARTLGLAAASSDMRRPPYGDVGSGSPTHAGDDGRELPMAATYVLAPCGRVTWAQVDPDVNGRADPDDVVAALKGLAMSPADRGQTAPSHAWESIL